MVLSASYLHLSHIYLHGTSRGGCGDGEINADILLGAVRWGSTHSMDNMRTNLQKRSSLWDGHQILGMEKQNVTYTMGMEIWVGIKGFLGRGE